MGLDMYLEATTKNRGILTDWTEIYYWRKVNAIHGYFDRLYSERHNGYALENCEPMLVTRQDLEKMTERLKKAIQEHRDGDDSFAKEWFPPTRGFFFGSYDMDEWYWADLEDAVMKFQELLNVGSEDDEGDPQYVFFKYYAWW